MRIAEIVLRIALALLLIVSSGDVFFQLIEHPEPPGEAQDFLISLTAAEYVWPLLGFVFFASGILLFFKRFTGLALVLLAPATVNMVLYHFVLDPTWRNAGPTLFISLLHLAVTGLNLRAFRSLVEAEK